MKTFSIALLSVCLSIMIIAPNDFLLKPVNASPVGSTGLVTWHCCPNGKCCLPGKPPCKRCVRLLFKQVQPDQTTEEKQTILSSSCEKNPIALSASSIPDFILMIRQTSLNVILSIYPLRISHSMKSQFYPFPSDKIPIIHT